MKTVSKSTPSFKSTATADAVQDVVAKPDATSTAEQSAFSFESLAAGFESMTGFALPSGKRVLCSLVAGLFTTACGAYAGMQVSAYLMVGAMLLTGSAFISWVISFIVLSLAIIAAMMAGARVQTFILNGGIDTSFTKAKTYVSGLFTRCATLGAAS